GWPGLGNQHGQAVVIQFLNFDVSGFEPSLDESCGGDELLLARGVVADQAFGENLLVKHPAKDRAGGLSLCYSQKLLEAGLVPLGDPPRFGVLPRLLELALSLLEPLAER